MKFTARGSCGSSAWTVRNHKTGVASVMSLDSVLALQAQGHNVTFKNDYAPVAKVAKAPKGFCAGNQKGAWMVRKALRRASVTLEDQFKSPQYNRKNAAKNMGAKSVGGVYKVSDGPQRMGQLRYAGSEGVPQPLRKSATAEKAVKAMIAALPAPALTRQRPTKSLGNAYFAPETSKKLR